MMTAQLLAPFGALFAAFLVGLLLFVLAVRVRPLDESAIRREAGAQLLLCIHRAGKLDAFCAREVHHEALSLGGGRGLSR